MKKIGITFCMMGLAVSAWSETGTRLLPEGKALAAWQEEDSWQPAGGWREVGGAALDPEDPKKLKSEAGEGVIISEGRARYLLTKELHRDVEVHVEFMVPGDSNSGLYFCGSHEVQILDSFGIEVPPYPGNACGGIYPEWVGGANVRGHNPLVNAALPPGEWQTFDIIYQAPRFDADGKKTANARFVRVVHNGKPVQENVEVMGTTRSGLPEKAEGPLRLQGDHGPVAFRNLLIRDLTTNAD